MPSPIRLLLLAPLLAWSLAPAPAEACSVVTPGDFEVDDTLDDANPPAAIEGEVSVSVKRGVGPVSSAGGVQGSSSCDDIGQLVLSWQAAVDAEAGEGSGGYELQPGVGYRFAVVEGTLPDGLSIPQHAQSAFFDVDSGGASTIFVWIDDASDDQEPFDFTLSMTPVDAAGNEGPSTELGLSHPGSVAEDKGCAVAPLQPLANLSLLALGLVAIRRVHA